MCFTTLHAGAARPRDEAACLLHLGGRLPPRTPSTWVNVITPATLPPQVDLIVCYDATSSPTRSIQRMGRTGRHKVGGSGAGTLVRSLLVDRTCNKAYCKPARAVGSPPALQEGRVVYILAAGREAEAYNKIEEVRAKAALPRVCPCPGVHPLPRVQPCPGVMPRVTPCGCPDCLARPWHPTFRFLWTHPSPCLQPCLAPQNTKALHRRLRNPRGFDTYERAPRMLPHAYEPQRMDVAVEHTPEKVIYPGLG